MKIKLLLVLVVGMLTLTGCHEEKDGPEPEMEPYYYIRSEIEVPGEAGSKDIAIYTREVFPVCLLTNQFSMIRNPELWHQYEAEGALVLTETVYSNAGYTSLPDDLNFVYTYDWLTISMGTDANYGNNIVRLTWKENSNHSRQIYLLLKGREGEKVIIVQQNAK